MPTVPPGSAVALAEITRDCARFWLAGVEEETKEFSLNDPAFPPVPRASELGRKVQIFELRAFLNWCVWHAMMYNGAPKDACESVVYYLEDRLVAKCMNQGFEKADAEEWCEARMMGYSEITRKSRPPQSQLAIEVQEGRNWMTRLNQYLAFAECTAKLDPQPPIIVESAFKSMEREVRLARWFYDIFVPTFYVYLMDVVAMHPSLHLLTADQMQHALMSVKQTRINSKR